MDAYSEVREVKFGGYYEHPMNEVFITASFDKKNFQIKFDLYQGKYLSNTNRLKVISIDYISQEFKDYIDEYGLYYSFYFS
jgi:hypothetical protein